MKKLLLMVPVVAFVATGCVDDRTYVDPESSSSFLEGRAPNDLNLQNGTLSGDFGPRQGFDGPATEITGVSDRQFATSTTTIARTENGRGTGMIILWTNGAVLEQLEQGTYPIEYDPSELDQADVAANVCSGSDSASIDYDAPAEAGTLVVTRTPEGRTFDIQTETPAIDAMGNPTGQVDTASSTFTLVN